MYVAEKIAGVSDKARSRQVQPQNQQQEQAWRRSSSPSDTIENDSFGEGSDDDTFGVSTLGDSTYNDPTKEEEPGGGGEGDAAKGGGTRLRQNRGRSAAAVKWTADKVRFIHSLDLLFTILFLI